MVEGCRASEHRAPGSASMAVRNSLCRACRVLFWVNVLLWSHGSLTFAGDKGACTDEDAPKIRMLKAVELGDSQQGAMGVYAIGEGVNYDEIDFTICYTAWQTTRCTPSSGVNKNVTIALPGTSVTALWQPKPANYTSNCIGTASWYVCGSKSTLLQVNASITLTISTKYGGCAQSPSLTFNLAEYFGPEQHSCQQLNSKSLFSRAPGSLTVRSKHHLQFRRRLSVHKNGSFPRINFDVRVVEDNSKDDVIEVTCTEHAYWLPLSLKKDVDWPKVYVIPPPNITIEDTKKLKVQDQVTLRLVASKIPSGLSVRCVVRDQATGHGKRRLTVKFYPVAQRTTPPLITDRKVSICDTMGNSIDLGEETSAASTSTRYTQTTYDTEPGSKLYVNMELSFSLLANIIFLTIISIGAAKYCVAKRKKTKKKKLCQCHLAYVDIAASNPATRDDDGSPGGTDDASDGQQAGINTSSDVRLQSDVRTLSLNHGSDDNKDLDNDSVDDDDDDDDVFDDDDDDDDDEQVSGEEGEVSSSETTSQTMILNIQDVEEYLVDINLIQIEEEIGHGAFGVVHRGVVQSDSGVLGVGDEVALKLTKDNSHVSSTVELLKEVTALKAIGRKPHPNVMSMLGLSFMEETPIIILEYAARGNLLNTLRQRRGASDRLKRQLRELSSFTSDDGYSSTQKGPRKITYHRYTWHTSMPKAADLLRPDHVYELARQIARGMAFLASQKVVHCDLAARNILVTADYTLKISDFGQSRAVSNTQGVYQRMSNRQIPIKWHAVESLRSGMYTTASDVWSLGVVLWEIATLGCTPYPEIETKNLYPCIASGYRMDEPRACPEGLYDIMVECWNDTPDDRPSFVELVDDLEDLMQEEAKANRGVEYLSLDLAVIARPKARISTCKEDVQPQETDL
eukprot:scpid71116/ scgid21808/ Fibroblast growth factor receptor 4